MAGMFCIDRASVTRLLLKAERSVHRGGWDQPTCLAALSSRDPQHLSLIPVMKPIPDPPGEFLVFAGASFHKEPELSQEMLQNVPHIVGMAIIAEGWKTKNLKNRKPDQAIADMPDAKEIRSINAVDLLGRAYTIHRTRGEKPEAFDEAYTMSGQLFEGLRQITLAIAQLLPDNEQYIAALTALNTDLPATISDYL